MSSRVFITYRHESEEHRQRVAEFAGRLRDAGAEVILDQFFEEEHPGGPDQGWDKWSADQVKEADKILIVGSPGWFRSFEGKETDLKTGLGAACEARMIFTQLYDSKWITESHRIVFLDDLSADRIPLEIKNMPRFRPQEKDADFERLVRWITGEGLKKRSHEPESEKAPLWPDKIEGFEPDFADREEEEWPSVVSLLAGELEKRILLFEGKTNHGKSVLVRDCRRYAIEAGIAVATVDFKGGVIKSPRDVLAEINLSLKIHLPRFSASGGKDPYDMRQDLRETLQPVLLIFDTYETIANDPDLTNWMESQIFAEVEHCPGLAVIVAGQETPGPENTAWGPYALPLQLGPIDKADPWCAWIRPRFPSVAKQVDSGALSVEIVIQGHQGVPGSIAVFFENVEKATAPSSEGGSAL